MAAALTPRTLPLGLTTTDRLSGSRIEQRRFTNKKRVAGAAQTFYQGEEECPFLRAKPTPQRNGVRPQEAWRGSAPQGHDQRRKWYQGDDPTPARARGRRSPRAIAGPGPRRVQPKYLQSPPRERIARLVRGKARITSRFEGLVFRILELAEYNARSPAEAMISNTTPAAPPPVQIRP